MLCSSQLGFHPIAIPRREAESLFSTAKNPINRMNTTKTLNHLIEICKDGQDGFQESAKTAKHPELTTLFGNYAQQRGTFASELHQLVAELGEEPETDGSTAAAVHRGWIDLKAAITNGSDHAILAECERGEDYAVSAYQTALEEELPAHIRSVVAAQSVGVQSAHDDVRNRRDAAAA